MNRGEIRETKTGSGKAALNMYGERVLETKPALKKHPQSYSEKPFPKTRELDPARSDTGQFTEGRGAEETVKAQAESELLEAKKTVDDLTLKIEQSSSRAKAQIEDLEKFNKTRNDEGDRERNAKNYQYMQVLRELKDVKQELSNLKLEMSSLADEKRRAEKETEASNLKVRSYSSSAEALEKEIEEVNEEHVLVELARIEALKEYESIESQRRRDAEKYSAAMEESRKRKNEINQEINTKEELERKLAITIADVNMLESELKQVKQMDKLIQGKGTMKHFESNAEDGEESNASDLLQSITKEIETAKKELASVREEGFKFMSSMDIIRTELEKVSQETKRARKREEKADLTIQNLNAKLLRGNAKLEAASLSEEKAKSIVSNLSRTLEQLRTEVEAAKKERTLIDEETVNVTAEIDKTESEIDLAEERLQAAIEELRSIKSSEATALENLKTFIGKTMRSRASAAKRSSVITIQKFEYEYLKGRAAAAEEIADKKVAAAQAWIEALKASEKEILIKTEIAKNGIREKTIEEEQTERSVPAKRKGESESENSRENNEKIMIPEKLQVQVAVPGKSTPARRGTPRKSASPAAWGTPRSTSVRVRRRTKVMPNLTKFFRGKIIDRKM